MKRQLALYFIVSEVKLGAFRDRKVLFEFFQKHSNSAYQMPSVLERQCWG